jgi:ParB family chromosome partitioning protein
MSADAALPLGRHLPASSERTGITRLGGAFLIAVTKVRADPLQPRREFDEDELRNLADSIRERGIRQPIRVWHVAEEDVYQIVSGERRFRAALLAGLSKIPCILDRPEAGAATLDRRTVLVDQVVENWQREDLSTFDLSDALKELRDRHGMAQETIARATGKPKSEVSKLLSIQRVDDAVRRDIRAAAPKTFSRRHVLALARLPSATQPVLAARILDRGLTAAETEREAAGMLKRMAGRDVRGGGCIRRTYAVGSAKLTMTFRSRTVTAADELALLEAVRSAIEKGAGDQ